MTEPTAGAGADGWREALLARALDWVAGGIGPDPGARWRILDRARTGTRLWKDLLGDRPVPSWESLPTTSRALLQSRLQDSLASDAVEALAASGRATHPALPSAGAHQLFVSRGRGGELGTFVYSPGMWAAYLEATLRRVAAVDPALAASHLGPAFVGTDDPAHTLVRVARALWPKAAIAGLQAGVERCAEVLDRCQPEALYGFSSAIGLLAGEQLRGRLDIRPSFVFTGTDALTRESRSAIAEAWGVLPFDCYGSTEGGLIAAECAAHDGLHVFDDLVMLEDAGGRPLITNLVNTAQPIIRYLVEDVVDTVGGACRCGRPEPRIALKSGRGVETWTLPGEGGREVRLHPIVLRSALDRLPGVGIDRVDQLRRRITVSAGGGSAAEAARAALTLALTRAGVLAAEVEIEVLCRP